MPVRSSWSGRAPSGAHVAESLVREGRYDWCIVDDDRLLPHNLARPHVAHLEIGQVKAAALADRLNSIFYPTAPGPVTRTIGCNVLRPGPKADEMRDAFRESRHLHRCLASVAASRHIADLDVPGRCTSVFFNPSAEAAVVLVGV